MKKVIFLLLLIPLFITQDCKKIENNQEIINLNANETYSSDDYKSAYEYLYEATKELLNGIDFSAIESEFSGFEFLEGEDVKNKVLSLITGDYQVSPSTFLSALFSDLLGGFNDFYGYFALIVAVALLSSLIDAIKPSFMDKTLVNLTNMVCMAVVIGVISGLFGSVYQSIINATEKIERQSDAIFPILLTLMTASGANVSASIFKPQVAFLAKGMTIVVKNLLLPIILLLFVFNAISGLSTRYNFDKGKQFLKSTFKWITGFTVVIFNFFVTAQGLSASIYDGISVKALKYALSNAIPFVGGLVTSGFDTVMASMILIKNAVGGFALLAVLFTVIAPIIKLAVFSVFLRFSSAVIEPFSDKRLSGFLSSVADGLGYLTAVSAVSASSYFLTLLLIICSVGGGG